MSESIHALMNNVRTHPDLIWGTVFTWGDVQVVLDDHPNTFVTLTIDDVRNNAGSRRELGKAIENACMNGGEWSDAIYEILTRLEMEAQVAAAKAAKAEADAQDRNMFVPIQTSLSAMSVMTEAQRERLLNLVAVWKAQAVTVLRDDFKTGNLLFSLLSVTHGDYHYISGECGYEEAQKRVLLNGLIEPDGSSHT